MGGRGAASGVSNVMGNGTRGGNKYGTQFQPVVGNDGKPLIDGNVKYIEKTPENKANHEESLMETGTKGRVYVLVDDGKPESIVYFDAEGKRSKQIDLNPKHGGDAHVHRGYNHNEYSPNGRPTGLMPKEKAMVARVMEFWENHKRKS